MGQLKRGFSKLFFCKKEFAFIVNWFTCRCKLQNNNFNLKNIKSFFQFSVSKNFGAALWAASNYSPLKVQVICNDIIKMLSKKPLNFFLLILATVFN